MRISSGSTLCSPWTAPTLPSSRPARRMKRAARSDPSDFAPQVGTKDVPDPFFGGAEGFDHGARPDRGCLARPPRLAHRQGKGAGETRRLDGERVGGFNHIGAAADAEAREENSTKRVTSKGSLGEPALALEIGGDGFRARASERATVTWAIALRALAAGRRGARARSCARCEDFQAALLGAMLAKIARASCRQNCQAYRVRSSMAGRRCLQACARSRAPWCRRRRRGSAASHGGSLGSIQRGAVEARPHEGQPARHGSWYLDPRKNSLGIPRVLGEGLRAGIGIGEVKLLDILITARTI